MTRDEILKVWADLFNGEPPRPVVDFAIQIHDKALAELERKYHENGGYISFSDLVEAKING